MIRLLGRCASTVTAPTEPLKADGTSSTRKFAIAGTVLLTCTTTGAVLFHGTAASVLSASSSNRTGPTGGSLRCVTRKNL